MPQYSWITLAQAQAALAGRLADPNNLFWSLTELTLYLSEALRTWNALTEQWNADYAFSVDPTTTWYNLSVLAGSPRRRTLTDDYFYRLMQLHLLEPPTGGGAWTGTSQFNLTDLKQALQRRRDEMIQASGCNVQQLPPLPSTPNTRRTMFPDSTLEPRRARFIPDSTYGTPVTLTREDSLAWNAYQPSYLQTQGTPQSWSVITGPPLAMNVDIAPSMAGRYDVLSLQTGPDFSPPTPAFMGLPDDWAAMAKWGALADLLGRESEATDRQRAAYCLKRFNSGLEIMKESNWLLTATINGMVVDTPSVREFDGYSPEWEQSLTTWPSLVVAGTDYCAPCPVGVGLGCSVVLVGNAPVPVAGGDFVQVSRDVFDAVLDEAQFLAAFKQGGQEFKDSEALDQNFFTVAAATNKRLAKMGLYRDLLGTEGERQDISQPR